MLNKAHKKRPRIGLNGRFLVTTRTGVQRSAQLLFEYTIKWANDLDFFLFTSENAIQNLKWQFPNLTCIPTYLQYKHTLKNHFWEQFLLPRLCRKYDIDILHNPANLGPIFYKGKNIINIHDVCFLIEPRWFSQVFFTTYSLIVPILAQNATVVITNSNNSRNDILEYLKISQNKIRLIYWAVDPEIMDKIPNLVPYHLRQDCILYVGSLEPRKNLTNLLSAYNIFRKNNPQFHTKLLLVGCSNKVFAKANYTLGDYASDIEFLGYVNDTELIKLYQTSKVFIYPSLYEGFGLPPLEAMATGTPVITSNTSAIPEILKNAAYFVDPHNPEDIAHAIAQILKNPNFAQNLIQKGLEHIQNFSWDQVGKNVANIYREILNLPTNYDN